MLLLGGYLAQSRDCFRLLKKIVKAKSEGICFQVNKLYPRTKLKNIVQICKFPTFNKLKLKIPGIQYKIISQARKQKNITDNNKREKNQYWIGYKTKN